MTFYCANGNHGGDGGNAPLSTTSDVSVAGGGETNSTKNGGGGNFFGGGAGGTGANGSAARNGKDGVGGFGGPDPFTDGTPQATFRGSAVTVATGTGGAAFDGRGESAGGGGYGGGGGGASGSPKGGAGGGGSAAKMATITPNDGMTHGAAKFSEVQITFSIEDSTE